MDIRWLLGMLGVFLFWAARTSVKFVLFGHLFVIPVLVLVAFLMALLVLALLAVIVRSFLDGGLILGRS